jgi:hypothetical protein
MKRKTSEAASSEGWICGVDLNLWVPIRYRLITDVRTVTNGQFQIAASGEEYFDKPGVAPKPIG